MSATARARFAFVLRFFAGFCLVANGLYIAIGTLDRVGDSGELLRHGTGAWQLWLFGAVTAPLGLWLWHRQGVHFGFAAARGEVDRAVAYGALAVCVALIALALVVGGA